jgi:hypothetical protein
MKRLAVLASVLAMAAFAAFEARAGEIDILLTKLVEKNVLTPAEAQIIADETKLQVTKDIAQAKSISSPEWTQRIRWGGDVRFRTQGDWGKPVNNQVFRGVNTNPQATGAQPATNNTDLRNQRIRERVRGRFWMEGKVNDFTYSGVRFAGGLTDSRSTNDTLDDYWSKDFVMFDQYWMRFDAPSDFVRDYGQYFSDLKLWAGRFNIPFEYSEIVWDSDINPQGMALQYGSADIRLMDGTPSFNIFTNLGFFWLNEEQFFNTDDILYAGQMGLRTEPFGPFNSTLMFAGAIYDFANLKDKTPQNSARTNTRVWLGDYRWGINVPADVLKYEYNVMDLLFTLDNSKFFEWNIPHGFYADYIHNASAGTKENTGYMLGGYVGSKKIKNPGDWKVRCEWRHIERDAIPDFMPDSDFYGFGTYVSTAQPSGINGCPAGGGTNGRGINMALEYQLFKNTALNFEYYWMKPIISFDKTDPWNELQIDIITKF